MKFPSQRKQGIAWIKLSLILYIPNLGNSIVIINHQSRGHTICFAGSKPKRPTKRVRFPWLLQALQSPDPRHPMGSMTFWWQTNNFLQLASESYSPCILFSMELDGNRLETLSQGIKHLQRNPQDHFVCCVMLMFNQVRNAAHCYVFQEA